jgi:hypothetical protein
VEVLLTEPHKVMRDLLAETVVVILKRPSLDAAGVQLEFPATWPELLPAVLQGLQAGAAASDFTRMHNALLALRKLVKQFEFVSKDRRQPLNDIVGATVPLLLQLLGQLLPLPQVEAAEMIKQILKIFWS